MYQIFEGSISPCQYIKDNGAVALTAVEMIAATDSDVQWAVNRYHAWRRTTIRQQKESFLKCRDLFEEFNALDKYNEFKKTYFENLDNCTTVSGFWLLFLLKEAAIDKFLTAKLVANQKN